MCLHFGFFEVGSLFSPGWSGTHYFIYVRLVSNVCAFQVLELQMCVLLCLSGFLFLSQEPVCVSPYRPNGPQSTWDCRCGPQGPAGDCLSRSLLISLTDNLLLTDGLLTNGFHSCESDDDDRTSHASSSDWTPRPRIGMLQACASLKQLQTSFIPSVLLSVLPFWDKIFYSPS